MSAMKVAFLIVCIVLVITEAANLNDNNNKSNKNTKSNKSNKSNESNTTPRMTCKRILGILKKVQEVMKACELRHNISASLSPL